MSEPTKAEELVEVFSTIESDAVKNKVIKFVEVIAELSKHERNYFTIEQKLCDKSIADYVGHQNIGYIHRFIKCIVHTNSIALKDKMIELVEMAAE